MLFAGLWERCEIDGEQIISTTTLTGPSPTGDDEVLRELGALHERTPLAMTPEMADQWMKPAELEDDELDALIELVRAGIGDVARGWEVYEVDPAVGNVHNDGAGLLEPAGGLF